MPEEEWEGAIDPEEIIRKQKEIADYEEKRYKAFKLSIRDAIKLPGGRQLIAHIIELTNVGGHNFTDNERETVYLQGRESIGHDLVGLLTEIDPTFYPQLLLEISKEVKQ